MSTREISLIIVTQQVHRYQSCACLLFGKLTLDKRFYEEYYIKVTKDI